MSDDMPRRLFPVTPLAFLTAYAIGLSHHDCGENPTKYAVAVIVLSSIKIALFVFNNSNSLQIIDFVADTIGFVFFVFAWIWFAEYTGGLNVVQYLREYGSGEWLTLPLVLRIMYFEMWFFIAMCGFAAVCLVLTLISYCFCGLSYDVTSWSYFRVFRGQQKPKAEAVTSPLPSHITAQ
ncbi:hypothetical protein BCR33DRAFT_723377 [Rhizoclosmatium globosum]|uniref:Uncharacterized protein n=1 Tax=Rhizoclosmatium globosum TaxID=329046 RepID=A0A1Y2BCZ7_9FUNG|nr:hypothetical protein BCR33DRAFT_723377 [Rhizoclosmatium globosum]|eukprot:ORY32712.1 hypothetical protein BCR33DRAFT_723377 [Rhizoclosmatium globosum]